MVDTFCPYCGARVPDPAMTFCENCGNKLSIPSNTNSTDPYASQIPSPKQNSFDEYQSPNQNNPYGNQPPNQNNPYGNQPPNQNYPYGQPPNQNYPYGQPPNQNYPYGQPPNQNNPYGQPPNQNYPYGQPPNYSNPYGGYGVDPNQGLPWYYWILIILFPIIAIVPYFQYRKSRPKAAKQAILFGIAMWIINVAVFLFLP